jgi:hypothetical protein
MAVSGSLRIVGESFPKNKDQARESILNTLAHSAAPSDVSRRRQFAFAIVQATLITAGALVLMVGAAAAAGVDLSSVPRHVADTLAKPLPLSAESLKDRGALKPGEREPGNDSGVSGREVGGSVEAPVVQGQPFTLASGDSLKTGGPIDENPPADDGPSSQTNPAGNSRRNGSPPETDPAGRGANAPGNDPPGRENGSAHQGTQPGTTDPPGKSQCQEGQPGGSERSSSDSPNTQEGNNKQGQNDSIDNRSNGGGLNEQNIGDSGESNSSCGPASSGSR